MHSYEFISHSEEETIRFADEFASKLNGHSKIVLSGDLGSGKTKFTEGLLRHFGLEDEISSPTFTIVNEYDAPKFKIYHFDLYRLEDISILPFSVQASQAFFNIFIITCFNLS